MTVVSFNYNLIGGLLHVMNYKQTCKTVERCENCDRRIKTTVFYIGEQNDPISPRRTLKFHQRTRTKINVSLAGCQL